MKFRRQMIKNEIGVSTHIVRGIDPETHFPLFAQYGFSLIELNLGYFPILENDRKFRKLQNILAQNKIRVWSFHLPYGGTVPALGNMDISHPDADVRRNTIDAIRLSLDRLAALNACYLVLHPSVGAVEDDERKERLAFCAESLKACLKSLREAQSVNPNAVTLKIAIENLPKTGIGKESAELIGLLESLNSPELGICMDVNHANLREDLIEATRRYGHRVVTAHISDNDGINEKHWLPGKGVIPWKKWLATLIAIGYNGPLLYETSQPANESAEETIAQISQNAHDFFLRIVDANRG